ncbi:MAG: PadR family transcriptional regulator [Candidatus Aenigmarchaeota archaeon]|nr:PadR family transcriptional regulator [Candidatus Aenigmarchaeota archaeon]
MENMWASENKLCNEHLVTFDNINESTNHLLSGNGHILYLYTPETDKYKIYVQFLSGRNTNALLITDENLEKVREILIDYKVGKLTIINPSIENINKFFWLERGGGEGKKSGNGDFGTIIIDCTSPIQVRSLEPKPTKTLKHEVVHKRKKIGFNNAESFLNYEEREKVLSKLHCDAVLCMYDITKLGKDDCRRIVEKHSKAIIIKDNNMLDTGPSLANTTNGFFEKFVKDELKTIILAMVSKEPICGINIKKRIYDNFHVLLSSGTLYPLLHKLEKEGLLQSKLGFEKVRIYTVIDRERITRMLNDHMQAKNFLNMFLRSNIQGVESISLLYEKKE